MAERQIAVLGAGIMGGPIARHFAAAGYRVRAWDIDRDRRASLAVAGVTASDTAADAVAGADVVLTMLPDATVTAEVCRDAFAAFHGVWIQSATVGLEGIAALLEIAVERGVTLVDCPMLGTRSAAEAAELTALASGPPAVEATCREVLAPVTRKVLWLGAVGQGTRLKLIANCWVTGLVALTAETIALAEGLGFDGDAFLDLIAGGPLDVAQAHVKGEMMQRGEYPPALPLRHAAKDARLISRAAADAGLKLSVTPAVAAMYETAGDAGYGDDDMAAVFRVVKDANDAN